MSIGSVIKNVASGLVEPVANVFTKREERKQAAESADAKIKLAKVNGDKEITLTDAEWEAKSIDSNANTWKDEYLTIVVTSPIVLFLIGGVWLAFTGDSRLLDGTISGINAIAGTGVDMGWLMNAVVLAGVGLKVHRTLK